MCVEEKKALLKLLPGFIKERGYRLLSFETWNYNDWIAKTRTIEKITPRYLPYPHIRGGDPRQYDGFYGYVIWQEGQTFSDGEYMIKLFFHSDEYHVVYVAVKRQNEDEACIFRLHVPDILLLPKKY